MRGHGFRHDPTNRFVFIISRKLEASAARGASHQKHVFVRYISMFVIIYVRQTVLWTTTPDERRDSPPRSILRYINKPRLVSKLIFFQTFFESFSTEFQNDGGRKPRLPPQRDDEQV
jgi:hypothetical protein